MSDGPQALASASSRSISRPSDTFATHSSTALGYVRTQRSQGWRSEGAMVTGVMKIGVALPQYDFSIAGEKPLLFETIVECGALASRGGADSVWLSDHLFLDV